MQEYTDLINGLVEKPGELAAAMIRLHDMVAEDLTARDAHAAELTSTREQLVETQKTAQQLFIRVTDPNKAMEEAKQTEPHAGMNAILKEMGMKFDGG